MAVRWGEITIGEIVAALGGSLVSGSPDRAVQGLCTDSRTMVPGHLFLALKGERYDGHDFLDEAVRAGKVKPGDTLLFVVFGAGFTWGAMVVEW